MSIKTLLDEITDTKKMEKRIYEKIGIVGLLFSLFTSLFVLLLRIIFEMSTILVTKDTESVFIITVLFLLTLLAIAIIVALLLFYDRAKGTNIFLSARHEHQATIDNQALLLNNIKIAEASESISHLLNKLTDYTEVTPSEKGKEFAKELLKETEVL